MVGAKRFLQLANRLPAYQGVIANAMAAEQNAEEAAPGGSPGQPEEVSIDAMNLMIPGLIERVEV
ncbi:hypothetical protein [Streptomyces sp. NPDC002994]|uniref:hypothetical protein n=1 Tax=Streptomyces sp. NPDC002994 TaxID=3154441 RepID=UPI0033A3297A